MNKLKDLDSNSHEVVENMKALLKEQFDHSKESWIMKGVYDYYLISNSTKAVDVIACVKEPHDVHFFDRVADGLKGNNKIQHLTILGHIVRRRPIWLFKITTHSVFQELIRLLKTETDILIVVSSLLIINILLPFIPGLLARHLHIIFSIFRSSIICMYFSKLAAMNATTNNYHDVQLIHLQISLYTLFHRLYGMFPCSFLSFLHTEFSSSDKLPVFSHTVKPMLDTVRLNPLLITASSDWEVKAERWKNVEPHDIITSCAKLLMSNCDSNSSSVDYKPSFDCQSLLGLVKVTGTHTVLDYCGEISRKSEEIPLWSPSTKPSSAAHHIESTPTTIPLTPITRGFEVSSPYSEHEGSSPPEAAIEATPETTPSRVYVDVPRSPLVMSVANRSIESFTKECSVQGSKVPVSDRSFPSSPIKKDVPQFQFSAPDVVLHTQLPHKLKKIDTLITDRNQATEDHAIRTKSVGGRNNLSSNFHQDGNSSAISNLKISASKACVDYSTSVNARPCLDRRQTNGSIAAVPIMEQKCSSVSATPEESNGINPDVLDDYEECELEKSGSPCMSGGLHMPDNKSLRVFAEMINNRYRKPTHPDSVVSSVGGCSTGTSPQEIHQYFNESKVRRTHSCPEMKKSSPSSTFSFGQSQSDKLSLPEEKEEENEDADSNGLDENQMFGKPDLVSSYTQTDEVPLSSYPYDHLFMEMFPPLHPNSEDHFSPAESVNSIDENVPSVFDKAPLLPSDVLQKYVDAAVYCHATRTSTTNQLNDSKFLSHQLKLMSNTLQFEEHRREIHAERNRRLLGRSRRNKTLEEHNSALKDQVLLQQKDLENSSLDLQKAVKTCKSEVEGQQKSAEYWRDLYYELEKDYKEICDKCSEIDSQLKEEKKANVTNAKQIYEGKAALIDVTNELRVNQREARVAKELRGRVAELQSEILKAGETVVRYHRRLTELVRPSAESLQHDLLHAAYVGEVNYLKKALQVQSQSLDSAQATITALREEIKNKENDSLHMLNSIKGIQQEKQKQLFELEKNYAELKKLYNREVEKVNELEYRLSNAKRVNRFQQIPPRSVAEFSRFSNNTSTISDSIVANPDTNVSKSSAVLTKPTDPSKSFRYDFQSKPESNVDKNEAQDGGAANEPNQSDATKLWRKGRMECAESGQLRATSQSDSDLSSKKPLD